MKKLLQTALVFILLSAPFMVHADPVNINQADAMTISKNLKGIGLKKAEAIVEYRTKHGPFKKAEDLAKVKGIGDKTVATNLKDIKLK